MNFILIPAVAAALALTLQPTVSAAANPDTNPVLADDSEKKDKKKGSGDEEPECE